MYFPNAFKKVFVAAVDGGAIDLATTGKTQDLDPGQIGLFDSKTYSAISAAPASGNQTFILAQGSYHTTDKIGPFHGGYQESVKSKVINPKYVSRFFKVSAATAQNQILNLNSGLAFKCGTTYNLRIDVKGSPALRFLNHNLYHTFDHFTGCCANDCSVSCTGDPVDPAVVMKGWADQINEDPIMSKFIQATPLVQVTTQAATGTSGQSTVTLSATNASVAVGQYVSGTGIAVGAKVTAVNTTTVTVDKANTGAVSGTLKFSKAVDDSYTAVEYDGTNASTIEAIAAELRIEVAYTDTKFGDCTFTVNDKYDLEPLFVYLSITDETGDPCAIWPKANSSTGAGITELQAPKQAVGTGETVLRDLILFNRYLQDPFPHGASVEQLRLREVLDDTALSTVDRNGLYDQVCILHNVPRLNNSTSLFDNDQYLLVIPVPAGTDVSSFTDLVQDILDLAGNGVTLETF